MSFDDIQQSLKIVCRKDDLALNVDAPRVAMILSCADGDGNYVGGTFAAFTCNSGTQWSREEKLWTAPADAVSGSISIRRLGTNTERSLYATNFSMIKQRTGATLITPGSVVSDLMAAKSVTAEKMAADSITAQNGAIKNLAVERLKLATGAVTELVRLSKTDTTSVSHNAGVRSTATHNMNQEFAANGTANMHKVSGASLTYTVPSSNPPEKLLIQPTVRMGMTFWDWNTGGNRAYNLVAGIKVLVDGSEALGWLVPGNNYSFYRTPQMSVPLMYHRPDVLLELGADYSAGDAVKFEVFIFRGDASGNFQFGFNMREHTVDILEFYK